jgi:hypothetical protein
MEHSLCVRYNIPSVVGNSPLPQMLYGVFVYIFVQGPRCDFWRTSQYIFSQSHREESSVMVIERGLKAKKTSKYKVNASCYPLFS